MTQIRAGTALSYLNLLVGNLLNLLLTPMLLRSLGQSGYGLYWLVGAFVAYMNVLDLGFGNAVVRYTAKFRTEGNAVDEGAFLNLSLRVFGVISAGTLAVGALLLPCLGTFFGAALSPAELSEARTLFGLMTLNLVVSFPLGAFQAFIVGHERFVFLRGVALVRILLRTALLVGLLFLGYRAVAIVIMDTCLNVAGGLLNLIYVRRVLHVRLAKSTFERSFVKELALYSLFVFANSAVDQLFWRIGHVVLGAMVGTASVAVFAIAMQFTNHYMHFPAAVSSVFLPRITAMVANGATPGELLAVFVRTARIQLLVLGYLLGGFVLFGAEFIVLWVGPAYETAWWVALVVMVPYTGPLVQTIGFHVLQAKNRHGPRSLIQLGAAAANAVLAVLLVRRWGPLGAAAAAGLALIGGQLVALNLYYHHRIGLDIPRFIRGVSAGLVPAIVAAVAAGWLLTLVPGGSWSRLALRGTAFTVLYAGALGWFGLNAYERSLFRSALEWARGRRSSRAEARAPAAGASSGGS